MKNTFFAFGTMAAAIFFTPESAQAADIGCVARTAPANLPALMLDGFVPTSETTRAARTDFEPLLEEALEKCLESEQVPDAYVEPYVEASSTSMLLREIEKRLLATGFPLAGMFELSEAYYSDPDLNLEQYLSQRPDDFWNPANEAARTSSVSAENILVWVVFYAEMNRVHRAANSQLP